MPELIEDGVNGLLAQSGVAESYAIQLQRLIEEPELRRELGAAARRSVERQFTDIRIAEDSVAVYRKCLRMTVSS